MEKIKQSFKENELIILAVCGVFSALSVYSIYAIYDKMDMLGSIKTVFIQLLASLLGIFLAFAISYLDYISMCDLWKLHGRVCYGLMVLCMFIGKAPEGTTNKAWIELPLGLSIQPSELLKISTILTLAYFFDKYKNQINEIKTLAKLVGIACVPLLAVAIQKDDGTLLVYCVVIVCMFFAAGVSKKLIALCFAALIPLSPILWFVIMEDYQKNRILRLFHPEEFSAIMWQQNMGRISIGSGRIFGKGFLAENHNNTPLVYNDFIFSFLSESLGFVGMLVVLGLILFLWIKILEIARRSNERRGTMICVGIFAMLMAQTVINIGMNLSLLPVIGVTLPLFSAGGTSIVVTYAAIGIVLSVARHNPKSQY